MQLPPRSRLGELLGPGSFHWATGIEDTFITAPHASTGRTLDEYELTGHYGAWRDDLALMASLGVKSARYGIPWHRVQPTRGDWQWQFADDTLGRMLDLGIDPQVDLVHYGLPAWIEDAFLHPDYPRFVSDYASRLAERFKGRIHWYTPLNEPRITAWYCGRLGWWPPYRRSWAGFVAVMLGICRGIKATVTALRAVDPQIVPYHVDATDLYSTADLALEDEAQLRQNLVFLALDLVSGRIDETHPLHAWLLRHGATTAELDGFLRDPCPVPVIGLNLYPMFTQKTLHRDARGRLRIRMTYAGGDLVHRLARAYFDRYAVPMIVSETASFGSVGRRAAWLEHSVGAVGRARSEGLPIVGYTWWPMFALITWAYRQGRRPVGDHILQMGLWDLAASADGTLARVETPLVEAYRALVVGGATSVGALAQRDRHSVSTTA